MSFAQNLYTKLSNLVKKNNAFYIKKFEPCFEGIGTKYQYHLFNYRLASYTDFTEDSALECRGIMFDVTDPENVCLKSLPMEKFFNLYENPFTIDLDLNTVTKIYEKADGSLISTYILDNQLLLKSKGSLISEHCISAMKWLDLDENKKLKNDIYNIAMNNKTVNMEWCSLEQRIVLAYPIPSLKMLNIRDHETGLYCSELMTEEMLKYAVESIKFNSIEETVEFIKNIPDMKTYNSKQIEGFVVYLQSGQKVKIKTKAYFAQHEAISNVKNPRVLYNLILEESVDDVRAIHHEDKAIMNMIDEMQIKVDKLYNDFVQNVEEFYMANKDLSKKDYAIKGKKDLDWIYFNLAMKRYGDNPVDYKEFLKLKWREFVSETEVEEAEAE